MELASLLRVVQRAGANIHVVTSYACSGRGGTAAELLKQVANTPRTQ